MLADWNFRSSLGYSSPTRDTGREQHRALERGVWGSSCLIPARGALGGGDLALLTRSQHPEQLPASLCSHKAEGLAWLVASSASPKGRICPSPSPAHAPAAGWAIPHLASPQTHLRASTPTTAQHPQRCLQLCTTPPGFYFKQKPCQTASSLLFRKSPLPAGSTAKRKRGGTF